MHQNPITEFIESIAVLGIPGLCIALVVVTLGLPVWAIYALVTRALRKT